MVYRKAKPTTRPLRLNYPINPVWAPGAGPHDIFLKWRRMRPGGLSFFGITSDEQLGKASLSAALTRVLTVLSVQPPLGCYYGAHRLRIGAFNELSLLQFSKVWLMHRLDWSSEGMLLTYYDSTIVTTPTSEWFFAHMRGD